MYTFIKHIKQRRKPMIDQLDIDGFLFGVRNKTYKINGESIINLVIYQKTLARPIAINKIMKKYQKLISILPDLIINDEGDGEGIRESLNQIEKFKQIIKNRYQEYLTQKELEMMSKNLSIFQKEAKNRFMELQHTRYREPITRSSHR